MKESYGARAYDGSDGRPYWGPAPRRPARGSQYGSRYSRQSSFYRKVLNSYKRDKSATKSKLTTLFIKLFLEEQKERSNDANNMKKAEVSSAEKADLASTSNAEGFTVKVYKCTTCGVASELCPIAVSEQEVSCAVVHETKTSFTSIEKSAFEYKPTQPGWYAMVMDFSSGGSQQNKKLYS